MNEPCPRLLLIDENVRDTGGHYLELATLLMDGAGQLGYQPTLAAGATFVSDKVAPADGDFQSGRIQSVFRSRRMNHWSLGVDGITKVQRDLQGNPIGGPWAMRKCQQLRDPLSRRHRNPQRMIEEWSSDFCQLLDQWQPTVQDQIIINTADDFVMLGLANALQRLPSSPRMNINAIFHFAVFASGSITHRAKAMGQQINDAIEHCCAHQVSLFATTHALAEQLAAVGVDAMPVPYPTRTRAPITKRPPGPLKILMAGMPRAEKGRDQIPKLLSLIDEPCLSTQQFRFSMQMRSKAWKRLIPASLHEAYRSATNDKATNDKATVDTSMAHEATANNGSLEIVSSDLPGQAYQDWLGTADIGLFLYDPVRYVARCSGVLLEMMIAGVPVIVPDQCWLADQLESAGGDGSIGYRYRNIQEIPSLLRRIRDDYDALKVRSVKHASVIAERHTGQNTIRQMRVPDRTTSRRIAS